MAKGRPCTLIVNNRWGYVFSPREFDSISAAVEAGRTFIGGSYWYVYDKETGKEVRRGSCCRSRW